MGLPVGLNTVFGPSGLVALPLAVLTLTKDICFAYGLIAAFLIGLDLLFAADAPIKVRYAP